jgi:outer membrane biosynthesis protein TonB
MRKRIALLILYCVGCSASAVCQQNNANTRADSLANVQLLEEYIKKHMTYASELLSSQVQGIVMVHFSTDATGVIIDSSVKALNSVHPALDREAEKGSEGI